MAGPTDSLHEMLESCTMLASRRLAPLLPRSPLPPEELLPHLLELTRGLDEGISTAAGNAAAFLAAAIERNEALRSGDIQQVIEWSTIVGYFLAEVMIAEGHQGKTINMLSESQKNLSHGRSKGGTSRAGKYPTHDEKVIITRLLKTRVKERGIDIAPASVEIAAELAQGNVEGITKKYVLSPETIRKYHAKLRGKC